MSSNKDSAIRAFVAFLLEETRGPVPQGDAWRVWVVEYRSRVEELRRRSELPFSDFLDATALYVAWEYAEGKMPFKDGDHVANRLWELFLLQDNVPKDVPHTMWDVYLAFDAGEFVHHSEPPGTDPVRKYTRPQIAAIVARTDAE